MCVSIKLASERECMYDACVRACVYMQCAICGVSKIARWAGSESCGVIHRQARRSAARLHSRGDTRTALLSSGQLHLGSLAVHVEDVVRIGRRLCSCATAVAVSSLHSLNEAERHSRVRGASRQAGRHTYSGRPGELEQQPAVDGVACACHRQEVARSRGSAPTCATDARGTARWRCRRATGGCPRGTRCPCCRIARSRPRTTPTLCHPQPTK